MARYYCPNCDMEYDETELKDGKCPDCGGDVEPAEEAKEEIKTETTSEADLESESTDLDDLGDLEEGDDELTDLKPGDEEEEF